MKYSKFIKENLIELAFLVLITAFAYLYFETYMTKSKRDWYKETKAQMVILLKEIRSEGGE